MLKCTLCGSNHLQEVSTDKDLRNYLFCETCYLIFVHPDFHLSKEDERSRYEYHKNGIEQPGYVKFLNRSIEPTLPFLNHEMVGLDWGCGPVPTLSKLLGRQNIKCFDYDPIFGFEHPLKSYDFIFATECFEHFFKPAEALQKINLLLKPQGILSIMTERWHTLIHFKNWYYKLDPTHVCFYHTKTFFYISEKLNLSILYQDNDRVIILKKIAKEEST